jgi:hypothetical protein
VNFSKTKMYCYVHDCTSNESKFGNTLFVENEGLPKMSKNINKRATKRKSSTENSMLKFLTVSSVSSDSIVKGIIDGKKEGSAILF